MGLAALVEVHTEAETEQALAAEARLIGINNRDLRVFRTDLETSARCRALIPAGVTVVSESGISQRAHVARLRELDVDAMLVGEALMREPDLAAKTRELVTAGRGAGL